MDEFIYSEAIVHPVMLIAPSIKNVLIIGGGDGGVLREVLKYNVQKCCVVEIDERVIKITKRFLPEIVMSSFEDPKVKLIYKDGESFVLNTKEKFNVCINDLTCSDRSLAKNLYTHQFYKSLAKILDENGCLVTVADIIENEAKKFFKILNSIAKEFKFVYPYACCVPSMGLCGFIIASNSSKIKNPLKLKPVDFMKKKIKTDFCNESICKEMFNLVMNIYNN